MPTERLEQLAEELAARDPALPNRLRDAAQAAHGLRDLADAAVAAFRRRSRELGADYLTHVEVSPVEADAKHVDCVSFRVQRGRSQLLCVAIAGDPGSVRLVGPFKQGKVEGPCGSAVARTGGGKGAGVRDRRADPRGFDRSSPPKNASGNRRPRLGIAGGPGSARRASYPERHDALLHTEDLR